MSGKLDRRKKYTRKVLKESLIILLAEKKIADITVKEICEIADINRSTFYTHYTDHYDLLHKIEAEITEDMKQYLQNYSYEKEEESQQMTEKILEYIIDNKRMFQTLLTSDSASSFEQKMMELARSFMLNNWMSDSKVEKEESEYFSSFVISGAIHVIKDWIRNDMTQPPGQMAAMIHTFINHGFSYVE
ncbi:TetR-like C-terminal domain-containing protein [Halobacillus sp. ACCC02827]|uniref:TetR/AcrR family transcriptional regulator n=1 Tax=Bacillaceae TaxID=186817 RepID=UPI0002A4E8D4|nr:MULTISPECIES: TetR-like C-terminal domain-containing protein [Bacillaceae]ELK47780.1 TetR/AcrR family transcriptional regulator [Halobacillus sp. BAB-2008]QHT45463.1 TetR/AcrR family transcriptional regulator [Bacillus sp. SB49]WJE16260.1 TetR-like C-terminal domain-containing protein [Halobacillus sp. ACCC02827]